MVREVLAGFGPRFETALNDRLGRKIGLLEVRAGDGDLIRDLLAAMAENEPRPVTTVVLAAALSLIGVVIFTWGLGIPMPAFRWSH